MIIEILQCLTREWIELIRGEHEAQVSLPRLGDKV